MATLTIRLSDEKHSRLRQLAGRRKVSVNKLIDELSTVALASSTPKPAFAPVPRWVLQRRPCALWMSSTGGRRGLGRPFPLDKFSSEAHQQRCEDQPGIDEQLLENAAQLTGVSDKTAPSSKTAGAIYVVMNQERRNTIRTATLS